MLDSLKTPLVLVGRLLIALMFVQSGYEKLTDLAGTAGYIASGGLPNSTALAALTGIFELVAGIVRREEADYIALARPFIREPHLARRWQEGDEARARCISCNGSGVGSLPFSFSEAIQSSVSMSGLPPS